MDYHQNNNLQKTNSFSIVAMIFGILSVIPCCMGTISIPFGALGILFAVLTRRTGQKMNSMSFIGMWLSCLGLFYGLFLSLQTFIQLPQILSDPSSLEYANTIYESFLGMSFEEFLNTYYGIHLR